MLKAISVKDGKTIELIKIKDDRVFIFSAGADGERDFKKPNIQIRFEDTDNLQIRAYDNSETVGEVRTSTTP